MWLTKFRDQTLTAWLLAAAGAAALLWRPLPHEYDMIGLAFIVLSTTALVRFEPKHTLGLGAAIVLMYFLSALAANGWHLPSITAHRESHYIYIVLLTAFATAITASNAAFRKREAQATQDAIRAAEALTGAQMRAQLAETAISIGKLAAALSHEINSPLGVLRSGIQTLAAIEQSPEKAQQMREVRADLYQRVLESAARLDEVTQRLRRFVTLEEAELKAADLNELLTGVTWIHQSEIDERKIHVDLKLEPSLPALTCRPQLLTTAFSSMLSNAVNAVNGDGRIGISTCLRELEVEVTIRDNGRGMTPEEVETIFEPSFRVNGGRVSTSNWSLFNARQIVYEHGGTITVESAPGSGTAVRVVLPVVA